MRIGIVGHLAIDEIVFEDKEIESIGGPISYSGVLASFLGFSTIPVTKFGYDLKKEWINWLKERGINLDERSRVTDHPTTRYRIILKGNDRVMYLKAKCKDIDKNEFEFDSDGTIISPIAGELRKDFLREIPGEFRALDPQGLLRNFDPNGKVSLKPIDLEYLKGIDIIKVDLDEAKTLTDMEGLDAAHQLLKHVKMVLLTDAPRSVYLLDRGHGYKIKIPKVRVEDTTGAGDIMLSVFVCSYLKEQDELWALSQAIAITTKSLQKRGIEKVSGIEDFEELSELIYDTAKSFS